TIADTRLETLKKLGKLLHNEIKKGGVALIASGDFTHHEPLEIAERKDKAAIAFVERMDTDGFYNEVTGKGLSICGMGPVCAVMNACEIAGIKRAELLKYDTSASAGGNSSSVVGYAAISFK
ncbi:AmmeMemoRadiSam system protein B, partial [Candidatus Micrarchaeota archaeon]|nr:AmmeMemoRadiSam system protein B [Candidatus Micrarchaeota archaeon]